MVCQSENAKREKHLGRVRAIGQRLSAVVSGRRYERSGFCLVFLAKGRINAACLSLLRDYANAAL